MSPTLKKFGIAAGLLLTLGACLIGGNAVATGKDAAVAKELKTKLQAEFPKAKIGEVSPTPIDGLYEVVLNGRNVMYVDKSGKYLLDGELVDLKKKVSLTQQRMQELSRVDFASLPLEDAVKVVRGNGSRKMAVFTDPDCPFCKRLEKDSLQGITDVTIYQFLLPLDQLHPDAARKAALVWCAPDRAQAWNDLMLDGKEPAGDGKCDTPLARVGELAQKLGITGTPGIVFASGKLVPGAIPRDQIEKELAAGAK
jgi:thiol:disulfide interchange protein DsbC